MQELIKIEKRIIGADETNSVNARDLHSGLEIKKDFSNWIKTQIQRAGLRENVDYIRVDEKLTAGNNAVSKQYILTTDSSKHIAMMSQGQKAKEVRDYFIAVEKEYKSNTPTLVDLTPMLELIAQQNEMILKLVNKMVSLEASINNISQTQNKYILVKQENRANYITPVQADTLVYIIDKAAVHIAKYHRLDVHTAKRLIFGKFNSKFNIKKYNHLKAVNFNTAKAYLTQLKDKARLLTDSEFKNVIDTIVDIFEEEE